MREDPRDGIEASGGCGFEMADDVRKAGLEVSVLQPAQRKNC